MRRCDEPLWRENIMLFYLEAEPNEEVAMDFIDKFGTRYDLRSSSCMKFRYNHRNDAEKLRPLTQKALRDSLTESFALLTDDNGDGAENGVQNCRNVLTFIDELSGNADRTAPDMWVNAKLRCMLRLSNSLFILMRDSEGYEILESAVHLLENLFSLPNGTVLTYGTPKLARMSAKIEKTVFYKASATEDLYPDSMLVNMIYEEPLGHVNRTSKQVGDIEGFEREIVFSMHTCDILKYAGWDGFSRVKTDEKYTTLLSRVEDVAKPVV